MADAGHSTAHIWQAFFTNLAIAAIKAVAAFFTKSGSMLAEAIHSAADCSNQLLLLLGVKRAAEPASETHPLGYGRALYFWSFIVALLLFTAGGVFSIYEGVHKLAEPEPLSHVEWGLAVLFAAFLLEGFSTLQNVREMNKRRGATPFLRYLRDTKDSDLVVIFGENSAATAGLFFAMLALVAAWTTGDTRWDGVGSILVGAVLVLVALFLGVEVKSLLLGERADPEIEADVRRAVGTMASTFVRVFRIITVQQGPGEVMLAMKLEPRRGIPSEVLCEEINELERRIRAARPEVRWCFVEPDLRD